MKKPYLHLILLQNPNNKEDNILLQIPNETMIHTAPQALRLSSSYRQYRDWMFLGFAVGYTDSPTEAPRIVKGDHLLGQRAMLSISA